MLEEPEGVNHGCQHLDSKAKDKVEEDMSVLGLQALSGSDGNFVQDDLKVSKWGHYDTAEEEDESEDKPDWEVCHLADTSVEPLETLLVFDAQVGREKEISDEVGWWRHADQSAVVLVVLVAGHCVDNFLRVETKLHISKLLVGVGHQCDD